jgi:hypothetical protein
MLFIFGDAGDVFADDVKFEVYLRADFDLAEVGVLEGVGDNCNAE